MFTVIISIIGVDLITATLEVKQGHKLVLFFYLLMKYTICREVEIVIAACNASIPHSIWLRGSVTL